MQYQTILGRGMEIIENSNNKSFIIIGDNSIGKSELLRRYVDKKQHAYYIDSINRKFDIKDVVIDESRELNTSIEVVTKKRICDENFNLKDSFGEYGNIERFYFLYKVRLYELIKRYLGVDFSIEEDGHESGYGDGQIICKINNRESELSSGYQAIIRIFSELILYENYLKKPGKGIVVIDEIDEFLSPKNASDILNFLREEFNDNVFVVSTHSADLIAKTDDVQIIILKEDSFNQVDGNDFNTLTDVNTLFYDIFGKRKTDNNISHKKTLQRLFELKLINAWSEEENKELQKINFENLTPVEKILYKQIKEW